MSIRKISKAVPVTKNIPDIDVCLGLHPLEIPTKALKLFPLDPNPSWCKNRVTAGTAFISVLGRLLQMCLGQREVVAPDLIFTAVHLPLRKN